MEEIYEIATPDFITFSEFLNAVSIRRELAISLCGVDQLKCLCALNLCYISVGGLSGIHFPDRIQSLNLSNTRIAAIVFDVWLTAVPAPLVMLVGFPYGS